MGSKPDPSPARAGTDRPRLRLRLFPRAETAVCSGHPWVYGDSIREQNRPGDPGELAVIYDRTDRFLAVGFYDPHSPIRVRILQRRKSAPIDAAFWRQRIEQARDLRLEQGVFGSGTTGGRWINGESDGLPGLVADRYAGTLVVKLYAPAWLHRWPEIEEGLREVLAPEFLMLRLSRNLIAPAARDWGIEEGFRGEIGEDIVVFEESGILFESAVRLGQKTGFFLDQRENRRRVEQCAMGRDCLNAFSYSGGFSLYAARGGAKSVTDLDISGYALESAERNFALNQNDPRISRVPHDRIQADAFDWLKGSPAARYDLAVLDPPSLAPRQADRESALEGYSALASGGVRVLRPGGILIAASCSSHVAASDFFTTVRAALQRSGRRWREEWTSGHAADHPVTFPEGSYLKAICAQLEPN